LLQHPDSFINLIHTVWSQTYLYCSSPLCFQAAACIKQYYKHLCSFQPVNNFISSNQRIILLKQITVGACPLKFDIIFPFPENEQPVRSNVALTAAYLKSLSSGWFLYFWSSGVSFFSISAHSNQRTTSLTRIGREYLLEPFSLPFCLKQPGIHVNA
jgi:hypothetical protein